jgi:aminoglycoside phosphotransferase (APT) family kinase protein
VVEIRARAGADLTDALARASGDAPHTPAEAPAFTLVHGDVWGGNVVWQGERPTLVDWEFQRVGDPAEDLAYAVAMDDMPDALIVALLKGYGRPDLLGVVRWWRPLLAAGCARWYADEGDSERAATLTAQALRLTPP